MGKKCNNTCCYYFKHIITIIWFHLKGIVHPKMKILSLITHPHVVPNLKDLCSSSEHKIFFAHKKYSCSFIKLRLNHWWTILMMSLLPFWALNVEVVLLSMEDQKALGCHQKYLNLCSEDEWKSYLFGMTWWWVINNQNFHFLNSELSL